MKYKILILLIFLTSACSSENSLNFDFKQHESGIVYKYDAPTIELEKIRMVRLQLFFDTHPKTDPNEIVRNEIKDILTSLLDGYLIENDLWFKYGYLARLYEECPECKFVKESNQ